ncbi:hypothetical protein L873DRAFT_1845058 [Choiromyces venosus 120613-1]|uniref:Uncharacterized protein n=1 Tax=Choiromyces venosus 120613-1 TaxID=1336337 RepID=A0A3N4JJC3_9PEZI|nr:hypothetical protein L873DRAFT_1845058 [Choiromyces venosus 120613-1]
MYGVSQSKNLIIGFVSDSAKDHEMQWWNNIVMISKLARTGGKRIGGFTHLDFQTLKFAMHEKWLKEKKSRRAGAADLSKDFIEEDKDIMGKQILDQEEILGDKVDLKAENNIPQFFGIDEEVEKFEEKGIIGLSLTIDKNLESRSPELGPEY